jgi:hypothetical protein
MNGLTVSRLSLVTIFLILRLMLQQLLLAVCIEHGAVSFFSAAICGPTLFFSWSEVVTVLPTGSSKDGDADG